MDGPVSRHGFVDIHCHLLPGIDDGSKGWEETLAMATMAVQDGIDRIIVTPHQLGAFGHNRGVQVRTLTAQLQETLDHHSIPIQVFPGADVRIDTGLLQGLQGGDVLSLADQRRHVLLELPHEIFLPLDNVLHKLRRAGMVGILSHPERNQGLLQRPSLVEKLLAQGCLMQVTASSLLGAFGSASQSMAEWMVRGGLTQFLATDAHGSRSRRPLMQRAHQRVIELAGEHVANQICCSNPAAVIVGGDVAVQRQPPRRGLTGWWPWRRAG